MDLGTPAKMQSKPQCVSNVCITHDGAKCWQVAECDWSVWGGTPGAALMGHQTDSCVAALPQFLPSEQGIILEHCSLAQGDSVNRYV